MRSLPAFLAVAAAVTVSPGPAFALAVPVAAVHGRRAALANIAGNSLGVLTWGALAAVGVSAVVAANQLAYDALRVGGAGFLLWLGLRALVSSGEGAALDRGDPGPPPGPGSPRRCGGPPAGVCSPAWPTRSCRTRLRPRLMRRLERVTGGVLVLFGLRLATEAR